MGREWDDNDKQAIKIIIVVVLLILLAMKLSEPDPYYCPDGTYDDERGTHCI